MRVLLLAGAIILLSTLASATIFCSTPLSTVLVDSTSWLDLASSSFGSTIASAGANVLVLLYYPVNATYFSLHSVDHGVTFPEYTLRDIPGDFSIPTAGNVALISDSRDILAVGKFPQGMASSEFNLGEFAWNPTASMINLPREFLACGAKLGLFLCVVSDSPTPVSEGYDVYAYDTTALTKEWTRVEAEEAPVMVTQASVASDSENFMICGVGNNGAINAMFCSFTNGVDKVNLTTSNPNGATQFAGPGGPQTRLVSNNVPGTFLLLWADAGILEARLTKDLGETWTTVNNWGAASALPDEIIFTNAIRAFSATASGITTRVQNDTNPLGWDDERVFEQGLTNPVMSATSANYQDNYHVIRQDTGSDTKTLKSCIPTPLPTVAPSPSPSAAPRGVSSWGAVSAAAVGGVVMLH